MKELWDFFLIFFKIGSFTFGGGLAMLPQIQHEIVEKRRLISEEEIVDIFAISQSVPGIIAINSSIFIGQKTYGLKGAGIAALGSILPSFIAILLFVTVLSFVQDNIHVQRAFYGIRAACAALIFLAAMKLWSAAVKNRTGIILAIASFVLVAFLGVHVVWVVFMAASFTMTGFFVYKKNAIGAILSLVFVFGFLGMQIADAQWMIAIAVAAYIVCYWGVYFYDRRKQRNG